MSEIFNEANRVFLVNVYSWYVFAPVLIGIIFWQRLSQVQRLIFYIALLSAMNHLLSHFYTQITEKSNAWVFHLYIPILFWLSWKIYKQELKGIIPKRVSEALLVIAISFFVLNMFIFQGFEILPTFSMFSLSAIYIFWSVAYFYSLLKQNDLTPLEKQPLFWFTTGVLMYYSSTILIFLLVYNFLVQDSITTQIVLILNIFLNLVMLTAYLISIWTKPQPSVQNSFS